MKIVKFKKIGKEKYKLYLENNDTLILYEDVVVDNELILKKEIDYDKIDELIKNNNNYYAYEISLNYISIRLRSRKELENYLFKKNLEENAIDFAIKKLEKAGYLDDFKFAKAYLNDSVSLTSKGPYRIKNELIKNGVSNEIIDKVMEDIDTSIFKEKLYNLINKQLKIKKGSKTSIKLKLLKYFLNLGYDETMILDTIKNFNIKTNDEYLQKEYNKLYAKYKNKYEGNNLEKFISSKLYSKGYSLDDISKLKQANMN